MTKPEKIVLATYAAWIALVVSLCLLRDGLSADNFTRLLIIAYLATTFGWYWLRRGRGVEPSRQKFILHCSLNALVVEFCYMFSRPVFQALLIGPEISLPQALKNTLIDFAFTFPVYLLIFSLFWIIISRYRYRISEYVLLFSFAQALGDGNAFFAAQPWMLLFVPYVMLNYQAINVIPYLKVRKTLNAKYEGGALKYILPLILIPALYWLMGALIIIAGRQVGLE